MLSDKNVRDRISFAMKAVDDGFCSNDQGAKTQLDRRLFTDESIIELYPKPNAQNTRIRTFREELRVPIQIPKHGISIMVAGGLSANGLSGLHICDAKTTVTGDYYRRRILPEYFLAATRTGNAEAIDKRRLFPTPATVIFMQDGAPAHTARLTLNLLGQHFRTVWSKNIWPGNSSDLNPVEHLWAQLKESVFINPRPRNRDELIARVQMTWKSISIARTKNLVYSFPIRIRQCLERGGGTTDY
jgi:transposase